MPNWLQFRSILFSLNQKLDYRLSFVVEFLVSHGLNDRHVGENTQWVVYVNRLFALKEVWPLENAFTKK